MKRSSNSSCFKARATANLRYELFRSSDPGTQAIDTVTPVSGDVSYFLVCSANSCGLGGSPRPLPICSP